MSNIKKTKYEIYPGAVIGRWTLTEKFIFSPKGDKKILCHCECGTERYVLERSLKYGGSLSCGCLKTEHLKQKSYDLTGLTFGELTVIRKSVNQRKNGGIWWTCSCSCGNNCDVPATLLVKGRKTHCGCKSSRNYHYIDITGQKFNSITALYPTDKRDKKGFIIWHCVCNDCGKETDISYNELLYSNRKSCGCKKTAHSEKLPSLLTHVAGTSLDSLKSNKLPSNNTTGVKGVYFIKGKWVAKIVFQKKPYYLGRYDNFEDAVLARKEAEKLFNDGTVEYYNRWKEKADEEPRWAEENPIQIKVNRSPSGDLSVSFLPELVK